MQIAVLSDTHDHLENLAWALEQAKGCEALLFCGDFCAPFTLREMLKRFPGPIYAVLGNNAGDPLLLTRVAQESGRVTLYGDLGEVELAGRRIAIVHVPRLAEGLAALGAYDLVCCGHTHKARLEWIGNTLLLNPGDLFGLFGRPSFALYDSESHQARLIQR